MPDLKQVRYVTRFYSVLKGLKLVPFGIYIFVLSFRHIGWTGLGEEGDCTYTLPLLILMIILYFVIDRYYAKRFGEVKPVKGEDGWWKGILPLAILMAAIVLENIILTPFSLTGVTIAAFLIYSGILTRRWHYLAGGVAMIIVSLLPLAVGSEPTNRIYGTMGFVWGLTFGSVWMIIGLIDHFILVRAFKPVEEGTYARPE